MRNRNYITWFTALIFVCVLIYSYTAPKGLCGELNIFLCQYSMDDVKRLCYIFGLISFFSLISDRLSHSWGNWWQFAKWGGPIAIALIMLINAGFHHTPGGFMNMDAAFDQLLSLVVYTVFTLGSLLQIYRGYQSNRKSIGK